MKEAVDVPTAEGSSPPIDYVAYEKTPQFIALKRRRIRFVFPMAAFFLLWYFAFVLVAAYRPDIMATPVSGNINLGLLLGLGQFVTTFTITMWYVSFSNKKLDPMGAELRSELEKMEQK
jgi:uncharacterized membrane protein (DUF485 family)